MGQIGAELQMSKMSTSQFTAQGKLADVWKAYSTHPGSAGADASFYSRKYLPFLKLFNLILRRSIQASQVVITTLATTTLA
jgi:hypothetical protein